VIEKRIENDLSTLNSLHPYASLVELEANVDTIATVIDLSNCAIVIVKNGYSTFPPYSDLVYLG
jgi:hypothetical protein